MLDDIADSFDYKNKYAIVEYINYLIDLHANKLYMLIFTHNYDFYRTLSSRLGLDYKNRWVIEWGSEGELLSVTGQYAGDVYSHASLLTMMMQFLLV